MVVQAALNRSTNMSNSKITNLRRASLVFQIASFCCFVNGLIVPALTIRLFVEASRFPWFYENRVKDQMALSAFVFCGCLYGIFRYCFI